MAKYYLYFLLSVFIYINVVGFFEENLKKNIQKETLLKYKLKKQELYASNIKVVESMLVHQKILLEKNKKFFFINKKKETIVFSEIEQEIQTLFKGIGGKITQLNSGVVIKTEWYKKYPISLTLFLVPEDLDKFLKKLYLNKKYLFLDSINIYRNSKKRMIELRINLLGYQLV